MPKFFSFSEKAKYQHSKLMEKSIKEKYISNKLSEKIPSFHKDISLKSLIKTVS